MTSCFEDAWDLETRDETPENAPLIVSVAFLLALARLTTTLEAADLSEEVEEVEEWLGVLFEGFLAGLSPSLVAFIRIH